MEWKNKEILFYCRWAWGVNNALSWACMVRPYFGDIWAKNLKWGASPMTIFGEYWSIQSQSKILSEKLDWYIKKSYEASVIGEAESESELLLHLSNLRNLRTLLLFSRSVQFSRSVVSDSLWPHESQHTRPPCPSPSPGVHSDSRPSSPWCHPAISPSVVPFSSCPQSLPASESFPMSQLFAWGGQSTGASASASFLPKNTQGWSPLEWTGWVSL